MTKLAPETPIEVWFQDEMRVGQKNSLVYQWAKKGSRPRQPKDQRYENAYVFGAVCASRDTGVALIMPQADTEAMQAHLDAIGKAVAPGAHALLILDKAGWHTTRKLSRQPCVRVLHRHPRRLPRRLAKTSRRNRAHHLDRGSRLGHHRSALLKAGISY